MFQKRKGLAGEELPATLFAIILLFIFLASTLTAYSNYYSRAAFVEKERAAGSLAYKILTENQGIISDPNSVLAQYNIQNTRIEISDLEQGLNWSRGNTGNATSTAVSSLALLIKSGESYHPGRIKVYVG